jgi:hypothetical protein
MRRSSLPCFKNTFPTRAKARSGKEHDNWNGLRCQLLLSLLSEYGIRQRQNKEINIREQRTGALLRVDADPIVGDDGGRGRRYFEFLRCIFEYGGERCVFRYAYAVVSAPHQHTRDEKGMRRSGYSSYQRKRRKAERNLRQVRRQPESTVKLRVRWPKDSTTYTRKGSLGSDVSTILKVTLLADCAIVYVSLMRL